MRSARPPHQEHRALLHQAASVREEGWPLGLAPCTFLTSSVAQGILAVCIWFTRLGYLPAWLPPPPDPLNTLQQLLNEINASDRLRHRVMHPSKPNKASGGRCSWQVLPLLNAAACLLVPARHAQRRSLLAPLQVMDRISTAEHKVCPPVPPPSQLACTSTPNSACHCTGPI